MIILIKLKTYHFFLILLLLGNSCYREAVIPKGGISDKITAKRSGKPIPGVSVYLTKPNKFDRISSKETNLNGEFFFEEIEKGPVEINLEDLPSFTSSSPYRYSIESNIITIVELSMTPRGKVGGQIFSAESASPVKNAYLRLINLDDQEFAFATYLTEDGGRYVFDNLPNGFFKISVSHNDFLMQEDSFKVDLGNERNIDFLLER